MNRDRLDRLLAGIRERRGQTLLELADVTEEQLPYLTTMSRWTDVRRVLLRFGDHMREHANQIEEVRAKNVRGSTTPQRMLAEAEIAWGRLLAATVGLTDEDLGVTPPGGGWSVEQVLEHVIQTEKRYLDEIRLARHPHGSETDS